MRPPIRIELNDNAGPIYHRARDSIEFNPRLSDSVRSIEYVEINGDEGELVAFGWIEDLSYIGAIPKRLGLGGIRLRTGNIQVGDESLLCRYTQNNDLCLGPRRYSHLVIENHSEWPS